MSAPSPGVASFARAEVRALPLYAPEVVTDALDLSDSVNAWGAPPATLRAIAEPSAALVSRYPSPRSESLAPALLRYLDLDTVPGVRVVTGCGSDDVLDAVMRAFGSPGDRMAFSSPTFSMIPLFARLNGLEGVPVPFADDFDLDADRLVSTGAKITYVCAPNNPTATPVSRAAVEYVASHARGVVVLDEAYAEFAPESFADLVGSHERLLVVRTFSKAFGLAGLRVGYAAGASDVVGMVERARGPYKVSVLAERAAHAALADGEDALGWVRRHARLAVEIRERVTVALTAQGLAPLPSAANFLCIPTPDGPRIAGRLRDRKVLVRQFTGLPREPRTLAAAGGSALRVGVAPWASMQHFLDALAEVRAEVCSCE
jgi:histidinol-phosphate aminotransferase